MAAKLFSVFANYPEVVTALSQRVDGNMKMFEKNPDWEKNRQAFLYQHGIPLNQLVRCSLVHGKSIAVVTAKDRGNIIEDIDGLITAEPRVFLGLTVADCLPLYFFDPEHQVVGLAHAGWRGVYVNIAGEMIKTLVDKFKSDPRKILVGIGPGIGQCHFSVKTEVAEQFKEYLTGRSNYENFFRTDSVGTIYIDLKGITTSQLQDEGLDLSQIEVSQDCTYCQVDKYFSRRRDLPKLEAMQAVMGLE